MMRAAVWAADHHAEVALQMQQPLTVQQNEVSLEDWQAATAVLAYMPMAEAHRQSWWSSSIAI
jgi:hypothetical protein